ncbi:MAG: DUF4129 domain-containing protein [Firmicutes bacterium]|nr:DUF4129 domain-containing protein [Bacillota bacterium]
MHNRDRALLIGIYGISLASLAWALRLSAIVDLALLLMIPIALMRRSRPPARFVLALALISLTVWQQPTPGVALVVGLMALGALSVARVADPRGTRYIVAALLINTMATLVRATSDWAYVPLILLALISLASDGDASPALNHQRLYLTTMLAVPVAGAALLVSVVSRYVPWQAVIAGLFSLAAYPFLWILSRLTIRHLTYHPPSIALTHGIYQHTGHLPPTHLPVWVLGIGIVWGVSLLLTVLATAYRCWALNDPDVMSDAETEAIIHTPLSPDDREHLAVGGRLGPTRRFVRAKLKAARREGLARQPHETLREWLQRRYPGVQHSAASFYEAVRYGNQADTAKMRRDLQREWPGASGTPPPQERR